MHNYWIHSEYLENDFFLVIDDKNNSKGENSRITTVNLRPDVVSHDRSANTETFRCYTIHHSYQNYNTPFFVLKIPLAESPEAG
ncbi:MAG: hypothetical protein JXL67_05490 [Calditrichaeota bacterium]|nr:hypothetical protein [Calditrichota bacterium]